ncbi:hypothetical protein PABG_04650 [Paracoccidioides brasiliensis Pb03]|nr:hypothetical protein PABG_04650 [Paracoccidioides brasiliensis Pb03]
MSRNKHPLPASLRDILTNPAAATLETFDPWNSASTGHQRAEKSHVGGPRWRQVLWSWRRSLMGGVKKRRLHGGRVDMKQVIAKDSIDGGITEGNGAFALDDSGTGSDRNDRWPERNGFYGTPYVKTDPKRREGNIKSPTQQRDASRKPSFLVLLQSPLKTIRSNIFSFQTTQTSLLLSLDSQSPM